jgi:formate hydrogenlyase subunit 4
MTFLLAAIALPLHGALMLAAAPLLTGLLRAVRARLLGRAAPSPLQPFRDLARLARRQPVLAENASWLFAAAPAAAFAAVLAAALLVPSFTLGMLSAPAGDLLAIAGLLALARGILALAAMDSGTAIAGQGASRSIGIATLAEPALLLVVFTLALLCGSSNLDAIVAALRDGGYLAPITLGLALLALLGVAIARNGPAPLGDSAAMAGEFSGRHLALIEAAAALRLLVWLSLIAALLPPFGMGGLDIPPLSWLPGLLLWAAKLAGLTIALAVLGSAGVAPRPGVVPAWLGAVLLLALLAALLLVGEGLA